METDIRLKTLLTTGSLWILWTIVNFVRSNGGSATFMMQQPAKDGNNTIHFTIVLHMPRTYYEKNYLRINFFNGCEFDNCKVTFDPDLLYRSDAVVFHHDMMKVNPPRKRDNQKWIFASFETPFHTYNVYKKYKFDWVMSYRRDADVFSPYGLVQKRAKIPQKNYTSIFWKKSKVVAWISSNCGVPSKRDEYVKEMSKYIPVDIYGKCGTYSCSKPRVWCKRKFSENYKFYLSFENSLCNDYLTEKIFTIYMDDVDYIPVVKGAPNIKEHLPNNTYISAANFKSPKELAKFLTIVGKNESHYISLLKEKDKYYPYKNPIEETGMCNICRHLNEGYQINRTLNIDKWLWEGQCEKPVDIWHFS